MLLVSRCACSFVRIQLFY